jgi:hypothetical protein
MMLSVVLLILLSASIAEIDAFAVTISSPVPSTTSIGSSSIGNGDTNAFPSSLPRPRIQNIVPLFQSSVSIEEETSKKQSSSSTIKPVSKKEERLRMMKSESFHRRGFKEVRTDVEQTMKEQFQANLVQEMKSNNFIMSRPGVTVHLAKEYGFCWGVERSIALAYEAVNHFPDRKIHITNELIHNPEVNDKLAAMNVQFIEKVKKDDSSLIEKNFNSVGEGDVVILPAFGATFEEMDYFDKKVCLVLLCCFVAFWPCSPFCLRF